MLVHESPSFAVRKMVYSDMVSPCGTSVGAVHETRMELAVCLVAMTLVGMLVPLRATAVRRTGPASADRFQSVVKGLSRGEKITSLGIGLIKWIGELR